MNQRTKVPYQPGIGPHTEAHTIDLVLAEDPAMSLTGFQTGVPYGDGSRQRCDLCLGSPPDWDLAVEVKMIRMMGDNAKPNDNLPTHILSPYPEHRSAVTDCTKLLKSDLPGDKAILIYGYEYDRFPLESLVAAFELLAMQRVTLGDRITQEFSGLVHPVHGSGAVFGWPIAALVR